MISMVLPKPVFRKSLVGLPSYAPSIARQAIAEKLAERALPQAHRAMLSGPETTIWPA